MSDQKFHGYAAFEPKGQLSAWSYSPRTLGTRDVEIEITHCGICASGTYLVKGIFRDLVIS